MSKEIESQIISNYKKYNKDYATKWGLDIPGNQWINEDKNSMSDQAIFDSFDSVENLKVLEIGCGFGHELNRLKELGFRPSNLVGIDINADRIQEAKEKFGDIEFHVMSAADTRFEDDSFDIIMFYTVFSSIPDENLQSSIAKEAKRLLSDRGIIMIYDMRYPNPFNKSITPLKLHSVESLFHDMQVADRSITLIPQIARKLKSRKIYDLLHKAAFLRSHAYYFIKND